METAGKLSPLYPCDVTELDEVLAKVQNSFAMQKDSPLSGILGHFVLQMVAAGVAKKTWDRWEESTDFIKKEQDDFHTKNVLLLLL